MEDSCGFLTVINFFAPLFRSDDKLCKPGLSWPGPDERDTADILFQSFEENLFLLL
jgi:hypothetical protein